MKPLPAIQIPVRRHEGTITALKRKIETKILLFHIDPIFMHTKFVMTYIVI